MIEATAAGKFPHEFSGGQRQRIAIARAIILHPQAIILDEPVSALDVSVRLQIINLLADAQRRLGVSYLLISHDLATVRYQADAIAIMYQGAIVEHGDSEGVFNAPLHPDRARSRRRVSSCQAPFSPSSSMMSLRRVSNCQARAAGSSGVARMPCPYAERKNRS